MKKENRFFLFVLIILMFSISFVSAGFFSDLFGKKTGKSIMDDNFLFTKNGSVRFAVSDFGGSQVVKVNEVEGHFPKVDDVIPKDDEQGTEQHFDVKLLTDMLGALKASGFDRVTIKIRKDEGSATTFTGFSSEGEKNIEFKGVLMPTAR